MMGAIRGSVKSPSGGARAEVAILVEEGPPHPDVATLTDESGCFVLSGLSAGAYRVSAYVDGVRAASQQVQVGHDAPAVIEFTLNNP
jgi:hypothetical protein